MAGQGALINMGIAEEHPPPVSPVARKGYSCLDLLTAFADFASRQTPSHYQDFLALSDAPAKMRGVFSGQKSVRELYVRLKFLLGIVFLCLVSSENSFPISRPLASDSAKVRLMLEKLNVVGNVLYVGAHPDDENTAVLAALSLDRHVRTAYLSLTRGDGGQNLLGPEQDELLGIIRTQELLEARALDQAEQYFTRAIDFGFSKSAEEAIRLWGREAIVSDIVWIIRNFQPDVIITRFPAEGSSHGHHIASAILTGEAFTAAADPKRFPEQLKWVSPWQTKRLLWNRYDWGGQSIPEEEKARSIRLQVGGYNPLLGKSYTEIAGLSRSMHKSQAMGASQYRGTSTNYFKLLKGDSAQQDLLEGVDLSWKRIPGGGPVGQKLEKALADFDAEAPWQIVSGLIDCYKLAQSLPPSLRVEKKKEELLATIQAASGLWLEATSREPSAVPGGTARLNAVALNRSPLSIYLKAIRIAPGGLSQSINKPLEYNSSTSQSFELPIPLEASYTEPYWLANPRGKNIFNVPDQRLIGLAELPAPLQCTFQLEIFGVELPFKVPVFYRWVDQLEGERYRDYVIVPEVTVRLKEPNLIFSDGQAKPVEVTATAEDGKVRGELHLKLPPGWKCTPASASFELGQKGQIYSAVFQVSPDPEARNGEFSAVAMVGTKPINVGTLNIDYGHITPQMALIRAEGLLRRLDLKKVGNNLGYIMGSGDLIPEALRQIGYRISLLSDEELAGADLSSYDAILLGIRAYNTRPALKSVQNRLMDYVKNGGTLVAQYDVVPDMGPGGIGPYPFRISRDRVSVEEAPVQFQIPEHALLNSPNKITPADFEGWIQERGLYFADSWDSHYEAPLACNDPGESSKAGGLLYSKYGKGVFIYTGYSFFRELPAGVPGAYRLFVNLISAGSTHE